MVKVVVHPVDHVLMPPLADGQLDLEDAIARAGWDRDDPGKGVAVIDEHGREIGNPDRFEEPADIEAGQDMMAVLERRIVDRLRREAGISSGEDLTETEEEANDFDIRDGVEYVSGFEVEMASEFPTSPAPARRPAEEAELDLVAAEKELAELQAAVDARRAAAKAASPAVADNSKKGDVDPIADH